MPRYTVAHCSTECQDRRKPSAAFKIDRLLNLHSLSGVGSMESSASGRLGVATLLYIFLTQLVAVILGLILVLAIRPGVGFGDTPPTNSDNSDNSYTDVFTDLFRYYYFLFQSIEMPFTGKICPKWRLVTTKSV